MTPLGTSLDRTLPVGDWHDDLVGAHDAGLPSARVPVERDHETIPLDPAQDPT